MSEYTILSEEEITKSLNNLSPWNLDGDNLQATFKCASYSAAIAFIVEVGFLSEKFDHHPGFSVSYSTVRFSYCTHDVENKITDVDIKLAQAISAIVERFQ